MNSTDCGRLPTFLVIGAYKAGTTSIHHYLKQHPQIFMSRIKEIRFLTYAGHHELPLSAMELSSLQWPVQSLSEYEKLFAGSCAYSARGDVSPCYLVFPEQTIPSIRKYIPDAKLITILRHPVDRAYSSFVGLINKGFEEEWDFRHSLQLESAKIPRTLDGKCRQNFCESFYFDSLAFYFRNFPREQISVYLYEDLQQHPVRLLRDVFRFIGVDDRFVPDMSTRHNPSGWPRFSSAPFWIKKMDSLAAKIVRNLPEPIKESAQRLFNRLARTTAPALDPVLRRELTMLYRDDILRTQELIGRDLTHWLKGSFP